MSLAMAVPDVCPSTISKSVKIAMSLVSLRHTTSSAVLRSQFDLWAEVMTGCGIKPQAVQVCHRLGRRRAVFATAQRTVEWKVRIYPQTQSEDHLMGLQTNVLLVERYLIGAAFFCTYKFAIANWTGFSSIKSALYVLMT